MKLKLQINGIVVFLDRMHQAVDVIDEFLENEQTVDWTLFDAKGEVVHSGRAES